MESSAVSLEGTGSRTSLCLGIVCPVSRRTKKTFVSVHGGNKQTQTSWLSRPQAESWLDSETQTEGLSENHPCAQLLLVGDDLGCLIGSPAKHQPIICLPLHIRLSVASGFLFLRWACLRWHSAGLGQSTSGWSSPHRPLRLSTRPLRSSYSGPPSNFVMPSCPYGEIFLLYRHTRSS